MEFISNIIRRRRAIFPKSYMPDRPIDKEIIETLLENANHAPTHKLTEPWRFQVFHDAASRQRLGDMLAAYYKKHTPEAQFSEEKMQKSGENPLRAGAVIAIIMQRDPNEGVPEWEEIAAVAMAVQNMWLTCTEIGLGCYWSTPKAALESSDFFNLTAGQQCLGLFYLGWHEMPELPAKRTPVSEKITWNK
ncbi:MAG: nitroreductase [Saprospiraceae bacterium]|nr:nitroreductase [Saprospiraceae bacterium]